MVECIQSGVLYCPYRFIRCMDNCGLYDPDENACSILVQAKNSKKIIELLEKIAEKPTVAVALEMIDGGDASE